MIHLPVSAEIIVAMVEHIFASHFALGRRAMLAGELHIKQDRIGRLIEAGRRPGSPTVGFAEQTGLDRPAEIEHMI